MFMPEAEDTDTSDDTSEDNKQGASGGIDIMALLAAQAKKMESISTIEMMEVYGEAFSEVTLEEKNQISHRGKAFRMLREFLENINL